jgi:hypothetical protein
MKTITKIIVYTIMWFLGVGIFSLIFGIELTVNKFIMHIIMSIIMGIISYYFNLK